MILLVGSYGAGITVQLPRVPEAGETLSGSTLSIGHGGKSSNQAVAVMRQGGRAALITALGEDSFAGAARAMWDEEGVDHSGVKVVPGASMAGVIMVEPSGENRIVIAPGALDQLAPEDLDQRRAAFEAADVVVVGLEVPVATAEQAITLAHECGSTVVLNPAPAASLRHDVLALAEYVLPNETEHEFYASQGYVAPEGQTIILTRGGQGATITAAGQARDIPAYPQEHVVDTTGAGDTFVGTFAAALDAGAEVVEAVQRAVVASSLSVTVAEVIPSIPGRADVDAALATYQQHN